MSCIIDNGYVLGCASIGGIQRVMLGTYEGGATYALDADDVVSGVTSGATMYDFQMDAEFAGAEQAGAISLENGTVYQETVLSIKMTNLDKDLRNTALALSKAPLVALVQSNTGQWYLLGKDLAGRVSESNITLGTAMGDLNGATISITFKSQDGLFLIEESLIPESGAVMGV